ncbi:MAG: cation:proton antiporter [Candidatus Tectomicrobia bacterium]|uniref:Cation:proton antiporter n=1 Tax=Tectimicrobiota bacterium TaxID=2528274 RepID=A0A932M1M0_UNCTE|nr:cation:proton antiporter [Candidatus Tectomicrobia bacterium]
MEMPLLKAIVIIFGLSLVVIFICQRFRVPAVVGFLLTGVLAGPHGLGLIGEVREVETLAEVGVVLLLFTIGIEFSLKNLLQVKKSVLAGGSLQVVLTFLAAALIAGRFGHPWGESIFIGFLISLSSTAIVLKILQERAEVDSPHGRTSVAMLIFQDVIIVPMILFTPLLAGKSGNFGLALLVLLAKGVAIILLVALAAKWVVPYILHQVARTRVRELFLLSVVVLCLAVAWVTSSLGLSLALGAFLAGLIISESEYSHQAFGNVLPFRDVFASFFFVSIGMLLDVGFLLARPQVIGLVALGVMALKAVIAGLATALLGFPLRTAILVGLTLSQVGEFSFILSETGVRHGLLSGDVNQLFLAVSVVTMAATPFVIALAPAVAESVLRLPLPARSGFSPAGAARAAGIKDHLIIVGFGLVGKNVARAAKVAGISYLIIEINADTVKNEQTRGEPIYYGDAVHEAVLQHAGIKEARVLVVAISDPAATRHITAIARSLNPRVHVIVRTRYIQEMKPLYELGANEVVPEEFETSVEIFARLLAKYLIPRDDVEKLVAEVRADGYEMFRSLSRPFYSLSDFKFHFPDVEIGTLRVGEGFPLVGKSLGEVEFRKKLGVTVLAIRRDSEILSSLQGDVKLRANDVLFVLGPPDKIAGIMGYFRSLEG